MHPIIMEAVGDERSRETGEAVSRLYAYENEEPGEGEGNDAVA